MICPGQMSAIPTMSEQARQFPNVSDMRTIPLRTNVWGENVSGQMPDAKMRRDKCQRLGQMSGSKMLLDKCPGQKSVGQMSGSKIRLDKCLKHTFS